MCYSVDPVFKKDYGFILIASGAELLRVLVTHSRNHNTKLYNHRVTTTDGMEVSVLGV